MKTPLSTPPRIRLLSPRLRGEREKWWALAGGGGKRAASRCGLGRGAHGGPYLVPTDRLRQNRGFSETRTRRRVLECPSRAHAHTPRGDYYHDQHPPHLGTVERVTGLGSYFNLHLFHVGMGRLTARDNPNPQVREDGTTGKLSSEDAGAKKRAW